MNSAFKRLGADTAGGGKISGRGQVNALLSKNEAMSVKLFKEQLMRHFGPPDLGGDIDYSYSIQHNKSGYTFLAYSGNSGPSYGGLLPESCVNFIGEDYRIKPSVLQILSEFEQLISS